MKRNQTTPHPGSFSWAYFLLHQYVIRVFRSFYQVQYSGKARINRKEILIFAPIHQNALNDALAILTVWSWQPVFLARSDIFRSRALKRVLRFLKILPVYRIRDGFSELHKNDATFKETLQILENRNSLVILPEGNHLGEKRLRPLKKGIARIAMMALEALPEGTDLKIVPVGLDYQDYHRSGSQLLINFGVPFSVRPYQQIFAENPALAYNQITSQLQQELKNMMLHIDDQAHYPELLALCELMAYSQEHLILEAAARLQYQQQTLEQLTQMQASHPEEFQQVVLQTRKITIRLKDHSLTPQDVQWLTSHPLTSWWRFLGVVAGFPVYVWVRINHLLPDLLVKFFMSKIKDPQFKSSISLVGSLLFYPMFYLIQTLMVGIVSQSWPFTLAYLLSLPLGLLLKRLWVRNHQNLISSQKIQGLKTLLQSEIAFLKNTINLYS